MPPIERNVHGTSVFAPFNESCGRVVVAISSKNSGEVVPIPTLPRKYDDADVVAIKLPTVSCVPVAMSAPLLSVVIMELIGPVNVVPPPVLKQVPDIA